MRLLPNKMEPTINTILHTDGIRIAIEEITKLIPYLVLNGVFEIRHMLKIATGQKVKKMNLGFRILARGGAANKKGSFGYLVFPNEGRGSHNPLEQRFAERGIQNARPRILEELHVGIDKLLEEEL